MRRLSITVMAIVAAGSLAACGSSSSGAAQGVASAASAAIASSSAAPSASAAATTSTAASPSASAVAGNGVSDPAAATKAITKLYNGFFQAPEAKAKKMVEDGSTLSAAFKAALKLANGGKEKGKVDSVSITGPATANVVFDLLIGGKVVLPKSDGQAVYANGKWVVAKTTFCTLVALGGSTPPGC